MLLLALYSGAPVDIPDWELCSSGHVEIRREKRAVKLQGNTVVTYMSSQIPNLLVTCKLASLLEMPGLVHQQSFCDFPSFYTLCCIVQPL